VGTQGGGRLLPPGGTGDREERGHG
jgi:hypothetical protein